jgi:hypothetical protein
MRFWKLALLPSSSGTVQHSQLEPLSIVLYSEPNCLGCIVSPDGVSRAKFQICLNVLFMLIDKVK